MTARRGEDGNGFVYVVCTGNICRSPFAAVLFEEVARSRLGADVPIEVASAGIQGLRGYQAVAEMRREAAERGLDLSVHRAERVDPDRVAVADLVIAMTERHRRHLRRLVPEARDRVFTLKELVRLLEDTGPVAPGDADAVTALRYAVQQAHEARASSAKAPRPEDVADPYGAGRATYAACAEEIETLVLTAVDSLFARESRAMTGSGPTPARNPASSRPRDRTGVEDPERGNL